MVTVNFKITYDVWTSSIELPADAEFTYKYAIKYEDCANHQCEGGQTRIFSRVISEYGVVNLVDWWRAPKATEDVLFSSFFTDALFKPTNKDRPDVSQVRQPRGRVIRFQLPCPHIRRTHKLVLGGSISELGCWSPSKVITLQNKSHPFWQGEVELSSSKVSEGITYKYGLMEMATGKVEWETGPDRSMPMCLNSPGENSKDHGTKQTKRPVLTIINDDQFRFSQPWRGAGVAIPVFSLRTASSLGCGDFLDIKLLVDWASKVGLKVVQILPINDTVATHTWKDSYPYASISVYALHPMYMNIQALGPLQAEVTQKLIEQCGQRLNDMQRVDYEGVHKLKSRFLKLIYEQTKESFLENSEYRQFYKDNEEWLLPYAVFSYFRDLYRTADFQEWGKFSNVSHEELRDLADPSTAHYHDIAVHYFIQFHLHKQLLEASRYAKENGIVLKGDIPTGIYRHSVDAWMYPDLFNMNMVAGAPPDAFDQSGQNWNLPTYNWEEMARDGYRWRRSRLLKMAEYFSAYRIDHVLGFFRIWQVPTTQVQGIMGFFNPAIPIHIDEFNQRGLDFDYHRYCKPYIRDYFLAERFGDLAEYAKKTFLVETKPGIYELKPEVMTQAQVKEVLAVKDDMSMEDKSFRERLRIGLFSLIAEVLLFEVEGSGGREFHFRHSLEKTKSFEALDDNVKARLWDLYIDYFYKHQEGLWKNKALTKLPVIKQATEMLVCAEDLGMVPECVPHVLEYLNILRLAIQRMPADPKAEFWHPADTPYLCVASTSSHDMSTLRGWWEQDRERSQQFYTSILGHHGCAPKTCEPHVVKEIIAQHLYAPCMLSIFPLEDLVGMDAQLRRQDPATEQINDPQKTPDHYWRYRFHLNLESLLEANDFNTSLAGLIRASGRTDI